MKTCLQVLLSTIFDFIVGNALSEINQEMIFFLNLLYFDLQPVQQSVEEIVVCNSRRIMSVIVINRSGEELSVVKFIEG